MSPRCYSGTFGNSHYPNNRMLFLRENGFTLMETLIAIALMAVISLSAVSVFSLGLQIWKRTRQSDQLERKAALALEKISIDLRSAVRVAPVKESFSIQDKTDLQYKGTSVSVMIPSVIIPQGPEGRGGYGRKTYRWNQGARELCRSIETASDLYNKRNPGCEVLAKNVTRFNLKYRLPSGLSGSYSWYDEWDSDAGLPLGVAIEMEITPPPGSPKKTYKRIVVISSLE